MMRQFSSIKAGMFRMALAFLFILGTHASAVYFASAVHATPLQHVKSKWTQSPDMEAGTDYLSMHRTNGPVVVDDFQSDGRPIVGFHWWGSYFQDAGQGAERNVQFEISFHQDCPIGDATCGNGGPYAYSTPSNGNYFSTIVTAEEDFYGTTASGEDVYEYWLSLAGIPGPDFLGGTWNEVAGEIYWVDFAWDEGQFGTGLGIGDIWGWHESFQHNLDFAVQTGGGASPGGNPHRGPWLLLDGRDMAFEVLTASEPTTLAIFGIGLVALGFIRRRRNA